MSARPPTRALLGADEQPEPAKGRYLWLFVRRSADEPFKHYSGPGSQPLDIGQRTPPDHPETGAAHPHWRAAMRSLEELAVSRGYPATPDTLYWAQTSSRRRNQRAPLAH